MDLTLQGEDYAVEVYEDGTAYRVVAHRRRRPEDWEPKAPFVRAVEGRRYRTASLAKRAAERLLERLESL